MLVLLVPGSPMPEGKEGTNAIASVLGGAVNPSGKLPFSFPARLEDNAAHAHGEAAYPGVDGAVTYAEGILVGYRWHDTRGIRPLFPFGHGLSYTSFEYGKMTTDKRTYASSDEVIRVRLLLRNKGRRAGAEVVQLYASLPRSGVERAAKELKAFAKVQLEAGETREVALEIPASSLAYWDEAAGGWKVEPGEYLLQAGSSSGDLRQRATVTLL